MKHVQLGNGDIMNFITLQVLRKKIGITQLQLAELLGLTNVAIYNWEKNKCPISNIYIAILLKLEEKANNNSPEEIRKNINGFLLNGGIFKFLEWLYSNENNQLHSNTCTCDNNSILPV